MHAEKANEITDAEITAILEGKVIDLDKLDSMMISDINSADQRRLPCEEQTVKGLGGSCGDASTSWARCVSGGMVKKMIYAIATFSVGAVICLIIYKLFWTLAAMG